MKKKDAVRYFGTQVRLAQALGIRQSAIGQWGEDVPPLRQLQIQRLTAGKLRAAPDVLRRFRQFGLVIR